MSEYSDSFKRNPDLIQLINKHEKTTAQRIDDIKTEKDSQILILAQLLQDLRDDKRLLQNIIDDLKKDKERLLAENENLKKEMVGMEKKRSNG